MQLKASRQALKVSLIYIFVAGGWILFSDEFLHWLVRDPDARTWISIYKGWAFVLVTGGLLQLTVRRLLGNWEREAEQRREIMEHLRESDERYHQLFELESDALVLVDAETHCFVEVNQTAQQLYGYSREEFLQMQ